MSVSEMRWGRIAKVLAIKFEFSFQRLVRWRRVVGWVMYIQKNGIDRSPSFAAYQRLKARDMVRNGTMIFQ